jgi:hypothetical protein
MHDTSGTIWDRQAFGALGGRMGRMGRHRTWRSSIDARHTGSVHMLSWRWWLENRETGQVTIAQFPNWPLLAIGGAWIVGRLADDGSPADVVSGWASVALWCWWAADELARGVNPWRRALGAAVLVWQLARLLT